MDYRDSSNDELIQEIGSLRNRILELEESARILGDSERNLRIILDELPESVFFMKPDGKVLDANRYFVERLGANLPSVIGKNIYDFLPEEVAGSRKKWVEKAVTQKRPVDWIDDRSGMLMHHHIVPILSHDGEIDRLAVYAGDVTQKKNVENDLAQSKRVYSLLFRNMLDGVAYCKMIYKNGKPCDFMYIDVNDSFERHSGLKNVIGKKVSGLVPEITELDQNLFDIYGKAVSTGKPQRFEIYVNSMKEWFDLSVYGLDDETFVAVFNNITSRKLGEKQLQKSEQKFRRFIETANEGVWSMDSSYKTTLVNQKLLDMLGYNSDEMIGFPVTSFMFDEDLAVHRERMESRKHGKDDFYEHRFRHKDGHEVWTLVSARTLSEEDGGGAGSFAMYTDITGMKNALQALRESEERLKLKLDSILDLKSEFAEEELVNILDLGQIQAIMDDFYTLTGTVFALLDLRGNILCATGWQDICENFHRKHPETLKNCLESDLEGKEDLKPGDVASYKCKNNLNDVVSPLFIADKLVGHIYTGQFLYDDQEIDVEEFRKKAHRFGFDESEYLKALSLLPRVNRKRVATVMSFLVKFTSLISKMGYSNLQLARSILEQKRVESNLREAQEDLRLIVEKAPIILISSAGMEEQVRYMNPKFSEFLGYQPEEMTSWNEWWSLAYPDENYRRQVALEWTSRVKAAISGKTAIEPMEVKVRCKDGSEKIIEWGFVSTGLNNVVFGMDLTQRKLAEREKEILQEKFLQAQKMEAIGTLAGGIAHDFNNLLQVVIGYAELLNTDDQFPTELKKDLEKIIRAAMDGGELVKGLLTLGRKTPVKMLPLDLNQHISKIRKLLARTIPKMIAIELKLQEDLPSINADKTQVEQVLMNLAVNARDAMPNGGTLTIETSTATLDETSLANELCVLPGSYVRLRVADNGVGMGKDTLTRMFEPFFTTKEPGHGTGLGLAVVYGIVQQHNGYVRCSSEIGKGSVFDIFVPAIETTAVQVMSEEKQQKIFPHGAGKTVLLVDDDEGVRTLASNFLVGVGFTILEATDGFEALEVCECFAGIIDIVILDLIMPKMGGVECLQKLTGLYPGIRVVIASGFWEEGSEMNLIEMGAKSCLSKPFCKLELLEAVRSGLEN